MTIPSMPGPRLLEIVGRVQSVGSTLDPEHHIAEKVMTAMVPLHRRCTVFQKCLVPLYPPL